LFCRRRSPPLPIPLLEVTLFSPWLFLEPLGLCPFHRWDLTHELLLFSPRPFRTFQSCDLIRSGTLVEDFSHVMGSTFSLAGDVDFPHSHCRSIASFSLTFIVPLDFSSTSPRVPLCLFTNRYFPHPCSSAMRFLCSTYTSPPLPSLAQLDSFVRLREVSCYFLPVPLIAMVCSCLQVFPPTHPRCATAAHPGLSPSEKRPLLFIVGASVRGVHVDSFFLQEFAVLFWL